MNDCTPPQIENSHSENLCPPQRPNVFPTRAGLPEDRGTDVGLLSVLLSLPAMLIVGVACMAFRPGFLFSVAVISLTPVIVFTMLLAAFVLADLIRGRLPSRD